MYRSLQQVVAARQEQELGAVLAALSRATVGGDWRFSFDAPRKVSHAVAHHIVRTVKAATTPEETAHAHEVIARWRSASGVVNCDALESAFVIAQAEHSLEDASIEADDRIWLLLPETAQNTKAELLATVDTALRLAAGAGFASIVNDGAGVIVLLRDRAVGMDTFSWTVSALPSTIYIDYCPNPARLAEDLIHETSHAWLNECLRARDVKLALEPAHYSPWKAQLRSTFGMLHSGFAFGAVCHYAKWYLDQHPDDDPEVRDYFRKRLEKESGRLAACADTFSEVLDRVGDSEIRDMVKSHLRLAGVA